MIQRITARDAGLSRFRFYNLLVHVFVVILLISNLVGQKVCVLPFSIFGFVPHVSGAQLLFPLTYIFGDIFTEVYGYGASRRAIWLGLFANILLSAIGAFVVWFPAAPEWPNQPAFEAVFYTVPRVVFASLIAFSCGEFTNSYVMAKMKVWSEGRWLWTRTIGSTVAGQLVDTALFITIGFAGRERWGTVASLIFWGYLTKVLYETVLTPLTYAVVKALKRSEGIDVFDRETNFNPFARTVSQ